MFLAKLVAKPPQLVPSMYDVFGTDSPNPFDFDGPQTAAQQQTHADLIETRAATSQVPKATTVWAKTSDLGIVERKATPVDQRSMASSSSLQLKENAAPQAPDANFPDASQAVLIEGFVFPSHKTKLAKKVEKLLQKGETRHQNELVVSDSDESGESEDMDSDVSSASFALSDFDDDEVITLDELSLFGNLWRLLSSWVTHETNLVVAGLPVPVTTTEETTTTTPVAPGAEAEARALRYRMAERRNAFALMLNRPMPQTALKIKLAADRYINQKIADIVETFVLRDAIDARNSHQVMTEWLVTL